MTKKLEDLGRALYECLYADQGGRWDLVDNKGLWYLKADDMLDRVRTHGLVPQVLAELVEVERYAVEADYAPVAATARKARDMLKLLNDGTAEEYGRMVAEIGRVVDRALDHTVVSMADSLDADLLFARLERTRKAFESIKFLIEPEDTDKVFTSGLVS